MLESDRPAPAELAPAELAPAAHIRAMGGRDGVYVAASAFQTVVWFVVTPALTRELRPLGYGELALGLSIAQVLGTLLCFGLHTAAQRELGRGRVVYGRRLTGLAIGLAGGVAAALVATGPLWQPGLGVRGPLVAVVDASIAWGFLAAVTLGCVALLRATENRSGFLAVSTLQGAVAPACGFAAAAVLEPTATAFVGGLVAGQLAAAVAAVAIARPAAPRWSDRPRVGPALRFAVPLVPQQLSAYLLIMGDRLVIQPLLGSVANGRYSAAYSIGAVGITGLSMLTQAWLPRLFRLDAAGALIVLPVAMRRLRRAAVFGAFGIALGGPVVLGIWVPPAFRPAALAAVVVTVAASLVPYAAYSADAWVLLRAGRTGRLAAATVAAAVLNLVLNLALVPALGIEGSAVATVASYAALALASGAMTRGAPEYAGRRTGAVAAFAAAGLAGALTLALPVGGWGAAVRLSLGAACGAGVAFTLLGLRRDQTDNERPGAPAPATGRW